jgi:hypothetical protein
MVRLGDDKTSEVPQLRRPASSCFRTAAGNILLKRISILTGGEADRRSLDKMHDSSRNRYPVADAFGKSIYKVF